MQQPPYPTPSEGQSPQPQTNNAPASPPTSTDQGQLLADYTLDPDLLPYRSRTHFIGRLALKFGLIFGMILAIVDLIQIGISRMIIQTLINTETTSALLFALTTYGMTAIFALIYWLIYFFAGFFTAQRALQQPIQAASLACLWAALCYFLVDGLILAITVLSTLTTLSQTGQAIYLSSLTQDVLTTLVLDIGLGIGVGLLGGLLGRKMALK